MILEADDFEVGMYVTVLAEIATESFLKFDINGTQNISTIKKVEGGYYCGKVLKIADSNNLPYLVVEHYAVNQKILIEALDIRKYKFQKVTRKFAKLVSPKFFEK